MICKVFHEVAAHFITQLYLGVVEGLRMTPSVVIGDMGIGAGLAEVSVKC